MIGRLLCWLGVHPPMLRARGEDGSRIFRCSECGHEEPQVRRADDELQAVQQAGSIRPFTVRKEQKDNVTNLRRRA
jgi:hypothetical protein